MKRVIPALAAALIACSAQADPYLLMAEEDGCYWCERWHSEIAAIYPKTPYNYRSSSRDAAVYLGPFA